MYQEITNLCSCTSSRWCHEDIPDDPDDAVAGDDDDEDVDDDEDDEVESKKGKKKGKKVDEKRRDSNASDKSEEGDSKRTNQFSFVERATQTMNNALKVEMIL